MKTTDKELKELQRTLTDLAIKLGQYFKIDLDFSPESIQKVEKILDKVSKEYRKTKNDEGINGIALECAAYIITVAEKHVLQGRWERDDKMGKDSFPYYLNDKGKVIYPYSWCLKRIFDGPGDNVWEKYKVFILNPDW